MLFRGAYVVLFISVLFLNGVLFAQRPEDPYSEPYDSQKFTPEQIKKFREIDAQMKAVEAPWSAIWQKKYDALGKVGFQNYDTAEETFKKYAYRENSRKNDISEPLIKLSKESHPELKAWVVCAEGQKAAAHPNIKSCDSYLDKIPPHFRTYVDKKNADDPRYFGDYGDSVDRIRAHFIADYETPDLAIDSLSPETIKTFQEAKIYDDQLNVIISKKEEYTKQKPLTVERPKYEKSTCDASVGETRLDKPPGPLANAKIQDQDGVGTCYANALSLMYEAELGKPVSALDIALTKKISDEKYGSLHQGKSDEQEKDETTSSILSGDDPGDAARAAAIRGVCPREYS